MCRTIIMTCLRALTDQLFSANLRYTMKNLPETDRWSRRKGMLYCQPVSGSTLNKCFLRSILTNHRCIGVYYIFTIAWANELCAFTARRSAIFSIFIFNFTRVLRYRWCVGRTAKKTYDFIDKRAMTDIRERKFISEKCYQKMSGIYFL